MILVLAGARVWLATGGNLKTIMCAQTVSKKWPGSSSYPLVPEAAPLKLSRLLDFAVAARNRSQRSARPPQQPTYSERNKNRCVRLALDRVSQCALK